MASAVASRGVSPLPQDRSQPDPTRDDARTLAAIRSTFQKAAANSGDELAEFDLRLCGQLVAVRCVGRQLAAAVRRPLQHLAVRGADRHPDLTLELWDESAAGVAAPDLPPPGGTVWSVGGMTYWHSEDLRYYGQRQRGWVNFLDVESGVLTGWIRRAADLPWYEASKPLRLPLTVWHDARGFVTVHAGLIADGDRGVLLVGASGAGKSTASLACLSSGFSYLGDDLIALEEHDSQGPVVGHSLYNSVQLWPVHAARFPGLSPATGVALPDGEKLVAHLAEVFPRRITASAVIRAVVLPRYVGGDAMRLQRVSAGQALLALAPCSLAFNYSRSMRNSLACLARLVGQVPCYRLETGDGIFQIPDQIRAVLQQAGES